VSRTLARAFGVCWELSYNYCRRGAAIVRVKICGITNWTDAKLAVDAGADALGFNFVPSSPRVVTPADAWDIIRRLPPLVTAVGVFVNWPPDVVAALANALQLGSVQLHGAESSREVGILAKSFRVIKAFAVGPGFRVTKLKPYREASAFLLDGFSAGMHGGTGHKADWQVAAQANRFGNLILAGGITPENVAEAIAQVRPFAVDVASGVESSPRKKDARALRALMLEVQSANGRESDTKKVNKTGSKSRSENGSAG
jgi:phosphoribosylanthranilate isomerase